MADDIKIGLDGTPLLEAGKPLVDLLKRIDEAVTLLGNNNSIERMNRSGKTALGQLQSELKSLSTQMSTVLNSVATSIDKAGKVAQAKARTTGKFIGKEIAEGLEEEVSRVKVNLSSRMVLPSGVGVSVSSRGVAAEKGLLDELKRIQEQTGAISAVSAQRDAERERSIQQTLVGRKRFAAELAAVAEAEAQDEVRALRRKDQANQRLLANLSRQMAAEEKAVTANDGMLRARKRLAQEEQAELGRLATARDASNRKLLSSLAKFQTAQEKAVTADDSILKARKRIYQEEQAELAKLTSARNRANESLLSNLAKAAAARNAGIDRDAGFNAMSQSGQFSRASRVAGALGLGMSEVDAVAKYGAAAVAASRNLDALRGSSDTLGTSSKVLAGHQREVHSAMRGVAGAAGALFLTYGSLIPLTTTFLAATAVKEAIKNYKDLEYQIKFVKALSEEGLGGSTEGAVRAQLGATAADAGYDPLEAAKGLRLLAQSGLSARESLSALPTVLKVATVGELGVANATETLTGAVHAFGLELSDMERVGDVMAKAGAISNTSVERMAESMKQASTVAEQFHLSIEDASTAMVVLAKRNITGSAAGTSLTNMMRDLANPHGRAKKAAGAIGFDAFDSQTGKTKDLFTQILPELRAKLADFAPKAQQQLIADLTNNRGEKLLAALLGATDKDLAEIKQKLADSKGFVSKANDELMNSVDGDLKRLRATLDTSLAEAGATGSAQLRGALQELRETVASPEFIGAVSALVQAFTSLVSVAVKGVDLLTGPAGYVAGIMTLGAAAIPVLGLVGKIFPLAASASSAVAGIGAAAGSSASGAALLASTLARFGVVGLAVAAAGTAVYLLHGALTNKGTYDTAASNIDTIIKKQQDYYNSLVKSNNELAKQLGLQGADKVGDNTARSNYADARSAYDKKWGNFDIAAARSELNGAVGTPEYARRRAYFDNLRGNINRYTEDTGSLEKVRQKATQSIGLEYATGEEQKRSRQLQLDQAARHTKELQAALGNGGPNGKGYSSDSGNNGAARRAADEDYKNEKRKIELQLSSEKLKAEAVDQSAKVREAATQTEYDRGLIDFKTYQERITAIQEEQANARIGVAKAEAEVVRKGLEELKGKAAAQTKAGKADVSDALANEVEAKRQELQQADMKVSELVADQAIRRAKATTELVKPTVELLRNSEKEGALADERIRQELEKARIKGSGIELSEREQFIESETLRILGEQERKIADKRRLLKEQTARGAYDDPANAPLRDRLEGEISSDEADLARYRGQLRGSLGDQFDGKQWSSTAKRLASTMEGSIKDALTAGLTGDTTALQNFGKTLQKTVAGALVDAFYDAFVKEAVNSLARDLMNSLRGAAGGGGGSGGGGGLTSLFSVVGALGGMFGGAGGISSTVGIGTGSAVTSAIGAYGTGVAGATNFLLPFSEGGFTGFGGKYQPKGVVHGGEFVINKESTSKLGLGFLNSLNQYAEGGYVPLTSGPSMTSNPAGRVAEAGGGSIVYSPTTTVQVDSRSDRAAVIRDVQQVVSENQKQFVEQLKRVKVLPA